MVLATDQTRTLRIVDSVESMTGADGRARRVDQLPDGRTALIVRILERGSRGDVTVVGPRTRALLKHAAGFAYAVAIRIRPGWSRPVLGVPARALTDSFVPLEELWGPVAQDLMADLLRVGTERAALELMTRACVRRVQRTSEPSSARLARRAARLMEREALRVDDVAERLGVTARHLRRAFAEHIGVGPKDYARSIRLQRVLHLARTSTDWARIAADAGYFDQAHLIADFRGLVGLTPGAFQRRAKELELVPSAGAAPP